MKSYSNKQLKINALLNVAKQLASVIFPLITFPYITKVLGAEHYGQYIFTASIISYISLVAGLGITNYAIREGSRLRDDRNKFIKFSNEILTLNCLAVLISYILLSGIVVYYKNIPAYTILLLIQGVSVFFNVIGCEWLNVIYEDYAFITIRYIAFQTLAVTAMFAFIKKPEDTYKYAIISQLVPVLGNMSNLIHFRRKWKIRLNIFFNKSVFSHLRYVIVLFANTVSMLIYVNSDITLIGIICGDTDVGIYSVAVKIYTIVKQLLNAMMLVAVPQLARWAEAKPKEELSGQLNSLLQGLLILLIPAIIGLFSLSKPIILLLSDREYEPAFKALMILAVTLFFSTGVCFYSNLVLMPNNMEKHMLKATIVSAVLNIILNIGLIPAFGYIAAAFTTLVSEAFAAFYMLIVSRDKYFPSVSRRFAESLISGIIVFVICQRTIRIGYGNLLTIVIAVLISVLSWGCYWLLLRFIEKKRVE